MSVVTGISEFRNIVSIYAEGTLALRVKQKHFAMRPLEEGDEVELEQYIDSVAALQMKDAYEAALCCLDRSARSAAEIVRSLLQKGYVLPCAEAVAERLKQNGLVDDARYAQRIVEGQAAKATGIYAVKRKLRAKGISEEHAEAVMEALDDEQQAEAAQKVAKQLLRKYSNLPPREARAKLSQAIARRGFSWDSVRSAVDSVLTDDGFDDEF